MKFNLLASLSLSSAYLFSNADAKYDVYKATIAPIPGVDTFVSGSVVVFADADGVNFGGYVNGLQPGLEASNCTAKNGCGVHIHSGTGCEDSTAQGGHYFVDPITEDPWVEERYSSDANGRAEFASTVVMGTIDLKGRAFLVHAEDGSRIGCGVLEVVEDYLAADLGSLGDATATGDVTAMPVDGSDVICYIGSAMNLEPDLVSVHSDAQGPDCTAGNGCGVHVHAGTSCESKETQMGHYYSGAVDPWAIIGYDSTSTDGSATYFDCINTGESDYDGKAFIVHASDGSRVACGVLGTGSTDDVDEDDGDGDGNTVLDVIAGSPDHLQLTNLLIQYELADTLQNGEAFTVFAPTDTAFTNLLATGLQLPAPEVVVTILLYHVLGAKVMSGDIVPGLVPTLAFPYELCIEVVEGGVLINGQAKVTLVDVKASNGVVHVIDDVLMLPQGTPACGETPTDAPVSPPADRTEAPVASPTKAPVASPTKAPKDDSAGIVASFATSLAAVFVGLLATLV